VLCLSTELTLLAIGTSRVIATTLQTYSAVPAIEWALERLRCAMTDGLPRACQRKLLPPPYSRSNTCSCRRGEYNP
jgi:hypothetical protein